MDKAESRSGGLRYKLTILSGSMCLVVDQISKFWASTQGLVVMNSGISWGWLNTLPNWSLLILHALGLLILALSLRSWWSKYPILTGIFFGSGISNWLDRIFLAGVRDFLPMPIIGGSNNLADWGVCVSLLYLAWQLKKGHIKI